MEYNKLVRDRIPEIIRATGRECEVRVLPTAEYQQALLAKLVEEATEARNATPDELATELGDLLEVIDAVMTAFGLDATTVQGIQAARREARGGFEKRLFLVAVG